MVEHARLAKLIKVHCVHSPCNTDTVFSVNTVLQDNLMLTTALRQLLKCFRFLDVLRFYIIRFLYPILYVYGHYVLKIMAFHSKPLRVD